MPTSAAEKYYPTRTDSPSTSATPSPTRDLLKTGDSKNSSPDWWLVWFTAGLVFFALAQTVAMFRQACYMRRALADSKAAADAAKQSADAATTAAESAMATDRAWLILEKLEEPHLVPLPLAGTPPPPVQALHCYINFGKTPAFITAIQAQIIKLPRLADLPPEPNYNSVKAELNLPDVPIAAGTRTNPLWAILESKPLLSQQEIDEINQSAVFLYAFGYIRYRDVFRRAHETRWGCELIVPGGANMQYYWRMAGPHTYNNFD